jgi:YesN/AraC family two-component response regulator
LSDLCAVYRQAIEEIERAIADPVAARQAPGLRAALDFIHRHYSEPLDVKRVARVAGFAPTYFSELFAARQGTPFQKYVAKLRLARAQQLLQSTDFSVTRIAELAGYRGPQYLCRVFLRERGTTPLAYRKRILPDWFRKGVTKNRSKSKNRTRVR